MRVVAFRSSANCLINRCLIAISRARLGSTAAHYTATPHQTANACGVGLYAMLGIQFIPFCHVAYSNGFQIIYIFNMYVLQVD